MSATVIQLAPKSKQGKQHHITWSVNYNMKSKKFDWSVTIPVQPQVFHGNASTMLEAEKEVDKLLSVWR
ncbi:hypothetical protein UFOVP810_15 [uncultured Caudovirales phage]|uniref:Uncharacterized protein n=1 Tax=uncultured Caudovirales phage TaxID=2100421 RepID=A0A6J5NV43_9CAUD|nr:hypothetical protein UFOVP810_15 [uncultured Caudovirales phage]